MEYLIVQKSQLDSGNRLDAEFYCIKGNLKFPFVIGKDAVEFVQYGTSKELNEECRGYPILRLNEFDSYFIGDPAKYCDKISNQTFEDLRLKKGDVLVCRTNGNPHLVGKAAMVTEDRNIAFASYLFRIRPQKKLINSASLTTFLNSKYGRQQIEKFLMPSIQSNFSPAKFREIKIPILTNSLQAYIDRLLQKSRSQFENSKRDYRKAEQVLLEELDINNLHENNFLFATVGLSETKLVSRFDAEYFNSPCSKMLAQITKGQTVKLGDLADLTKGVEPGAEAYQNDGKLFIRVSSISKDGIIGKTQKYVSEELYNEYKNDYQPQVGEILLTKDASPGMACIVREPTEGIISSGVMRLQLKDKINPEYLTLVLNSVVGRLQAERDAGGSIIAHWKPEQIKNLIVPILPISTQGRIADLLLQSYQERKKATELLEEAKLKVEEMIEKEGEK